MPTGFERRDEARDNLAGRADFQPVMLDGPGLANPVPLRGQSVSDSQRIAAQLAQWGGGKLEAAVNKQQQRDLLDGQMAYQQGRTMEDVQTGGNKWALEGYRMMDAQTVASSLLAAQRQQIELSDYQLDPDAFRKQYVDRMEAMIEGLDPRTADLVREQMAQQMPTLVADHTVRRVAWQEEENYSSLERSIDVISRDPTATDQLVLFAQGGADSPSAGLSDARRQAATVDGVVRAFENDNPLAYSALAKAGLLGDNLTTQEQARIRAAQDQFSARRKSEYNAELFDKEQALMKRVENGDLDPSAAAEELSVLWTDYGIKMDKADAGAIYTAAENGQQTARLTRGALIDEALARGDRDSAANVIMGSLTGTESGGNPGAFRTNADGRQFGGLLQMGQARLDEYAAATGAPHLTVAQFRALPAAQQADIGRWHVKSLMAAAEATGAIGRTINGVTMTLSGLVAVAHLGGIGGMQKFVETNGAYNPSDELGTSLTDYASKHGAGQMQEFMSPEQRYEIAANRLQQTRERLALDAYDQMAPQVAKLDAQLQAGMPIDQWRKERAALYAAYGVERTKADTNHELQMAQATTKELADLAKKSEDEQYKLTLEGANAQVTAAQIEWQNAINAPGATPEQVAAANQQFAQTRNQILSDAGIKPLDRGDGVAAERMLQATDDAMKRHEKWSGEQAQISTAVSLGYLGDLPTDLQSRAFAQKEAQVQKDYSERVASKQMSPEQANAAMADDMNVFYANSGIVDPKVRRYANAVMSGPLVDKDGNPNPAVVDVVEQYAQIKAMNPKAAETMFNTAEMLQAEAVLSRAGSPGLIAEGVRNLGVDATRSPNAQNKEDYLARRDVQAEIDRVAKETFESEEVGWWQGLFQGDAMRDQSSDRSQANVDKLWSPGADAKYRSELSEEMGRLMRVSPGLRPRDIASKAAENLRSRTAVIGGDLVMTKPGQDLRKSFFGNRAGDFMHDGDINSAVAEWLRSDEAAAQYGNITDSTWSETLLGLAPGVTDTIDSTVGSLFGFETTPAMNARAAISTGITGIRPILGTYATPQGDIAVEILMPNGGVQNIVVPAQRAGEMYMARRRREMTE